MPHPAYTINTEKEIQGQVRRLELWLNSGTSVQLLLVLSDRSAHVAIMGNTASYENRAACFTRGDTFEPSYIKAKFGFVYPVDAEDFAKALADLIK